MTFEFEILKMRKIENDKPGTKKMLRYGHIKFRFGTIHFSILIKPLHKELQPENNTSSGAYQ
jgi:hypothetical protein